MNIYIFALLIIIIAGTGGFAYWYYKIRDPHVSYAMETLMDTQSKFKHYMRKMNALPENVKEKRRLSDFRHSADDIEKKLKNKKINAESAISSYEKIIKEIQKITGNNNKL